MAQPIQQLKEFCKDLARNGKITQSSILALMVSVRRMIESDSAQTSFSVLWFYSNWILHTEITRGLTQTWLAKISEAINNPPGSEWYTDTIARIMSLDKLRGDLIRLFQSKDLPTLLFENLENWQNFLIMVFYHLADTPLIQTAPQSLNSPQRIWVTSLRIKFEKELPPPGYGGGLRCILETYAREISTAGPIISFPVAIPEHPSAFLKH